MKKYLPHLFVIVCSMASLDAPAAETACPAHFKGGEAPNVSVTETRELCFSEFAILHSDVDRTPLWAAERLTKVRIEEARTQRRRNAFHAEHRLPPEARAELEDYARSGFDRGHMAPSGDMPDPESQRESFSLANMIPQDPGNNRGIWASLEMAVRDLAAESGEIFVVTGPIFEGERTGKLNDRVSIPSEIFKAVYTPGRGAAVYLTKNGPNSTWRTISLEELRKLSGIDAFPSLSIEEKERPVSLPGPISRRARSPGDQED
jgi:endonuclease G